MTDAPAVPHIPPAVAANAAFELGAQHHREGRLGEAEQLYVAALKIDPRHFGAQYYLGLNLTLQGRSGEAAEAIRRAIQIDPTYVDAHNELGVALTADGLHEEAIAAYEGALALNPDHVEALNNLGNAHYNLGRNEQAVPCFERALAVRPDTPELHVNLGNVLSAMDRHEAAVEQFELAIALRPESIDAHRGAVRDLTALDRHEEAEAHLQVLLTADPDDTATLNALGNALARLERHPEAIERYRRLIELDPDWVWGHHNLGNALLALKRHAEAVAPFERALELKPDLTDAHFGLGQALNSTGRSAEALVHYDQALALAPDHAGSHNGRGFVLRELGRLEESRVCLETAVALAPDKPTLYLGLAEAKRFTADDPHLAVMEQMAAGMGAMKPDHRMMFHYALGKVYGDLERYEESLSQMIQGAAMKRAEIDYNEAATFAMFRRVTKVFTPELFERLGGLGDPSETPVFIVGMPRSGTTLVEQILASHPKVFGAGELNHIHGAAKGLRLEDGGFAFPDVVPTLTGEALCEMGAAYLEKVVPAAPDALRITDKMTENFLFVGLIHLTLPNARIIRMRRDPLDVCLSCFSKLFGGEQAHTYDLAELGRYAQAFEELMAHWRHALPPGVMLEVGYEDLVADFEPNVRAILAHCGLEWDDRCLDFHQTDRPVRTASSLQVRRPLYKTSVGRWRKYGPLLAPLLESFGMDRDRTLTDIVNNKQ
jgi:tetratricopeptide (TPR) repeat protein